MCLGTLNHSDFSWVLMVTQHRFHTSIWGKTGDIHRWSRQMNANLPSFSKRNRENPCIKSLVAHRVPEAKPDWHRRSYF